MAVEITNTSPNNAGFPGRLLATLGSFLLSVFLVIAFVLVVTPISLIRRALGNDPMYREFTDDPSYRRASSKSPKSRLEKTY